MTLPFIPFADPSAAYRERKRDILFAVESAFDSGRYILGSEVEDFEREFAAFLGTPHATACANGTDAIELALRGMGIGTGAAVFTVSHTAVATVAAIERAGALPVLVDIAEESMTMCPDSLGAAIDHLLASRPELRPAAIIPVHLYGHACDMDPILALAERYGLAVIEDCAQAHGARYKGRMVGSMGNAASFSFYPTKNLGALGDGGGCACPDAALDGRLKALRQYGWEERYISAMPGINSRLDPVQAAILRIQLAHLEKDNMSRQRIAALYATALSGASLRLPSAADWTQHVYHLYVLRTPKRDALANFLRERGIGTAVHYPQAVHRQPAYSGRVPLAPGGLPVTDAIIPQLLSLPMYPQLEEGAVQRVCEAVNEWAAASDRGDC
ncbi:DegT/DnrJ/EryC1/StrS family aminotransferase [Desulfovibrio sp. OttesenSCG-928-G15]|nr:DegT/DnrJ/EryC1/StrS family aminotransferase [Desulfovibrio sp. OttesenSCG-928-G15]